MVNNPITAVWEITMGCNMRCKHCGSSCREPLPGELTTEEALKLCDELGEIGLKWVTLSGGEPTTRKDWTVIAERLNQNGVIPYIITNGWLFDENILEQAINAGISTIGFSIDGLQDTHDFIRRPGSYGKIMHALVLCRDKDINVTPITTINKKNLKELEDLKHVLISKGIKSWQVQMGFPMGNMSDHKSILLEPGDIDTVIDFAYQCMQEASIQIILADCFGYFNLKEMEIFEKIYGVTYSRQGCTAGKFSFGILHNGDILGCTSIRNPEFIEGNIKNTSLKAIWENPDSFSWNRNMRKEDLGGFCAKCRFGDRCLGGCATSKLTIGNSVYAENQYCSYNQTIKNRIKILDDKPTEELIAMSRNFAHKGYYQLAENALDIALERNGIDSDIELLNLYGYVSFKLGNYKTALEANEKVLQRIPNEAYALKGKGLCLTRMGNVEDGIYYLKKALSFTDETFMDPYYDLAIVLYENGRRAEAIAVIEEGRQKSLKFTEQSQSLYQELLSSDSNKS